MCISKSIPNVKKACVEFSDVASCCVRRYMNTRRFFVANNHRLAKNPAPGKLGRWEIYDSTILWIYYFRFRASNFTHSKRVSPACYKISIKGIWGLFLLSLFICINTWTRTEVASRMTSNQRKNIPGEFEMSMNFSRFLRFGVFVTNVRLSLVSTRDAL